MLATERNIWFDWLLEQDIDKFYNLILLESIHSNFIYRYSVHVVLVQGRRLNSLFFLCHCLTALCLCYPNLVVHQQLLV